MMGTQRQTEASPQVSIAVTIPQARPSSEPRTQAHTAARELTRLLSLAAEHGHLHTQPSPVPHEHVIAVYHLPPGEPGLRGNRVDVFYSRAAIRAQLLELGEPELRTLPNHDVCPLQPLTISATGRAWLAAHRVHDVPARLTPLDHTPPAALYPTWAASSWSGASHTR